jgi:uroporphyrinogen-III synthase
MSPSLAGLRILVTRARAQASDLAERLEALGASALILPSIEFEFLQGQDQDRLDDAIRCADEYDAVVLTSVRGVTALESRLEVLGTQVSETLSNRRLIAVGNVTAAALAKALREPDMVPLEFSASGILSTLGPVEGLRFLLLRADQAKKDLPTRLRERGAQVEDVVAYRIVKSSEAGRDVLDGPRPDVITFTSSSGVQNTFDRLLQAGRENWMEESPIACIGPVTANTVRELGYDVAIMAKEATIDGLVEALVQHRREREMSHA